MATWYNKMVSPSDDTICELLNTLMDLIPISDTGDNYYDLITWVNEGLKLGLITSKEWAKLRLTIGSQFGTLVG